MVMTMFIKRRESFQHNMDNKRHDQDSHDIFLESNMSFFLLLLFHGHIFFLFFSLSIRDKPRKRTIFFLLDLHLTWYIFPIVCPILCCLSFSSCLPAKKLSCLSLTCHERKRKGNVIIKGWPSSSSHFSPSVQQNMTHDWEQIQSKHEIEKWNRMTLVIIMIIMSWNVCNVLMHSLNPIDK